MLKNDIVKLIILSILMIIAGLFVGKCAQKETEQPQTFKIADPNSDKNN